MARLTLASATSPQWLTTALAHMDRVLVDHAHCEKKAAASAMSLVAGYPQHDTLVLQLSALAVEEIQHFRAVFEKLRQRGLALGRDPGDPYAQRLLGLARAMPRQARLMDRLLLFGLIEARSRERLALLGEHLSDVELAHFYAQLAQAEARHAGMFERLAHELCGAEATEARIPELCRAEAAIVAELPIEARIH